jgi:hypothetical protein
MRPLSGHAQLTRLVYDLGIVNVIELLAIICDERADGVRNTPADCKTEMDGKFEAQWRDLSKRLDRAVMFRKHELTR